jgi:hypothetical protein
LYLPVSYFWSACRRLFCILSMRITSVICKVYKGLTKYWDDKKSLELYNKKIYFPTWFILCNIVLAKFFVV